MVSRWTSIEQHFLLVSLVVIVLLIDRCWMSIDSADQSRDRLLVRSPEVQGDRHACFDYFIDGLDYSYFAAFFK
jgi:hypothetical protein